MFRDRFFGRIFGFHCFVFSGVGVINLGTVDLPEIGKTWKIQFSSIPAALLWFRV